MNASETLARYMEKHGFQRLAPKAVLFDMDGVLYNSMPIHAVCWTQSMAEYGLHFTAEDAYLTEGMRGVETIQQYVLAQQGRHIDESEAQRMYDEKARLFAQRPKPEIFDGVRELMTYIKGRGMGIGIVTGSAQRPLIGRLLDDFGAYIDERHITTAYDVRHGKPAPDPYLAGLGKAGAEPWQGIVVENAPLGVRAAVAAGCFTIAVNSGPLPDETLAREGADVVVQDMHGVLQAMRDVCEACQQGN